MKVERAVKWSDSFGHAFQLNDLIDKGNKKKIEPLSDLNIASVYN